MHLETIKVLLKRFIGFLKYSRSLERARYFDSNLSNRQSDVVVAIAAHGRHEILSKVVEHLLNYYDPELNLSLSVVVCVSDDDDVKFLAEKIADKNALHVIKCKNLPLGNKWQQAVEYAKLLKPKSLIICGSDDLISHDYISMSLKKSIYNSDFGACGARSWHVMDNGKKIYAMHYRFACTKKILGSGRVYSRQFMDEIDWKLFDCYLNSGLDYRGVSLIDGMKGLRLYVVDSEFTVLSIKGRWDMINAFDAILASETIVTESLSEALSQKCAKEYRLQ